MSKVYLYIQNYLKEGKHVVYHKPLQIIKVVKRNRKQASHIDKIRLIQ